MGQPLAEQAITGNVYQFAAQHGLGKPLVACEPRKASLLSRLPGIGCILFGSLLLALFFVLYDSVFSWWPGWQQTLLPAISIAWIATGCWLLLTPLLYPPTRVFLCSKGLLIYVRRKKEPVPWGLIMGIWKAPVSNQTSNASYAYTIRRVDGKTFAVNAELSNGALLGERLEDEVTRRLLPRAIATYKTGTPLYFGDIAVMAQGISARRGAKLLSWDEVEHITLEDATMSIHSKGNSWDWETMNISDVPNVSVFKGIVEHTLREQARNQRPHITAFNEGATICFDGLSISRQGIILKEHQMAIPWGEIAGIGVGEDEVIIRSKGKTQEWHILPLWMLSDAPRLRDLVEYIMRGKP
ncbi:MAG TPA: DUF6585 family protein [Ktedonobacteraceae bacterium]|nr:DUF6585 family protein [Ktedonobacteraceae bacterium]